MNYTIKKIKLKDLANFIESKEYENFDNNLNTHFTLNTPENNVQPIESTSTSSSTSSSISSSTSSSSTSSNVPQEDIDAYLKDLTEDDIKSILISLPLLSEMSPQVAKAALLEAVIDYHSKNKRQAMSS